MMAFEFREQAELVPIPRGWFSRIAVMGEFLRPDSVSGEELFEDWPTSRAIWAWLPSTIKQVHVILWRLRNNRCVIVRSSYFDKLIKRVNESTFCCRKIFWTGSPTHHNMGFDSGRIAELVLKLPSQKLANPNRVDTLDLIGTFPFE